MEGSTRKAKIQANFIDHEEEKQDPISNNFLNNISLKDNN